MSQQIEPDMLSKAVERAGLVPGCFTEDDVIDVAVLDWYKEKFKMCIEDGVPDAVNAYLHHACVRTDINDITKVAIMQECINA